MGEDLHAGAFCLSSPFWAIFLWRLRSNMNKLDTRKTVMIGMLSAFAFIMACLGNLIPIKVAGILGYDPKDIIIAISGFILGPVCAIVIAVISSFLELITVSTTGIIGFVMNVISTCFFVVPASIIYQRKRTFLRAIIGLLIGVLSMSGAMMLWNYLITPMYMAAKGVTREIVTGMLLPVFLPFNLVKGALNASLTMLLYKPVVSAMRQARLLDEVPNKKNETKVLLVICCLMVVAVSVLGLLILGDVI